MVIDCCTVPVDFFDDTYVRRPVEDGRSGSPRTRQEHSARELELVDGGEHLAVELDESGACASEPLVALGEDPPLHEVSRRNGEQACTPLLAPAENSRRVQPSLGGA